MKSYHLRIPHTKGCLAANFLLFFFSLKSCSSYAPSTAASVTSCTSSPRLPPKMESDRDSTYSFKPIIRRPSMERSRLRLHVDPPPPPPRTVTLLNKSTGKEGTKICHNSLLTPFFFFFYFKSQPFAIYFIFIFIPCASPFSFIKHFTYE